MLSKPMNTLMGIVLLSVSVALISGIGQLQQIFSEKVGNNTKGIDMVVGAKGSPLQLVLSSVLHIDAPTGNIPLTEANKIMNNPMVKHSVPLSYGDNYKGYRIIGTDSSFFRLYGVKLASGTFFDDEMEVVVGQTVAQALNLTTGSTFKSSHGLLNDGQAETHEEVFTVTGILEKTNSVADNLLITSLESIWHMHGHEGHEAELEQTDLTEEYQDKADKDITALLVSFKNPMGMIQLPRQINENTTLQAALPSYELERLSNFTGIGTTTLTVVAFIIFALAGVSLLLNLFKLAKERTYELALLKTYGASTAQLFGLIFYEALFLCLLGYFTGIAISKIALHWLSINIIERVRFSIEVDFLTLQELYLLMGVIGLAILATSIAILPIFKMNISKVLNNEN